MTSADFTSFLDLQMLLKIYTRLMGLGKGEP